MDKIVSIDIIISCYNVEQTIEKCIMSLCSQSYPKNKYHCYFVNDASTDKTGEILDNFSGEKSIIIIHHEKNKGLSAARNNGIIQGNSELIAFLDGDMMVENNWIESFLPYFSKNTIAVMGDNIPPSNVKLNPMEKYYFGNNRGARQFNDGDNVSFQYMLYGNAMIRRNSLIECGLFDENITKYGGEDTDLSAKIWEKYPNSFVFSTNSTAIHFHRRTLKGFCLSMNIYGKYNLPVLMKRYPHYEKELGADWIYSIKGYLLFNSILYLIIKSIYSVMPLQILIRYMVIYSVVTGARDSK